MELGFGATGAWAATWFQEAKSLDVLSSAIEHGIRHVDTAGFYSGGHADERLARQLRDLETAGAVHRHDLTISTKVGKKLSENGRLIRDFGETSIREAIERHLRLFDGHRPDIVYMHGPDEEERRQSLDVLLRLKSDGLIGAIGECHDDPHLRLAASTDGIDVLMGRYNFLNTTNAPTFQTAKSAGKQVIVIAPLAQGLWDRKRLLPTRASAVWYLARALIRDPQTLIEAQKTTWFRGVEGWPILDLALGFLRLNEAIDVVLTTSTHPLHIQKSAQAFGRALPREIIELLRAQGA